MREERGLPWQFDRESLSGVEEDSASESQVLRLSHTSSKFDSAFGSQTDEESGSLHKRSIRLSVYNAMGPCSMQYHRVGDESSAHQSHKKRRRKSHSPHEHSADYDTSSTDVTPNLLRYSRKVNLKSDSPSYSPSSFTSRFHQEIVANLKRADSSRSISSTTSNSSIRSSSSRILSLGLSIGDLRDLASKPHLKKVDAAHSPATSLEMKPKEIHAKVQTVDSSSDMDTGNSGASTPILSKNYQQQLSNISQHQGISSVTAAPVNMIQEHDPVPDLGYPLTPAVIVIDQHPGKDAAERGKEQPNIGRLSMNEEKKTDKAAAKVRKKPARVTINPTPTISQQKPPAKGTVFYHESLTPQLSPRHKLPKGCSTSPMNQSETISMLRHANAPKRTASILQRLRRKHGSFKSTKHAKRYVAVKRSFSDRMTYDIRKGWIDYEEDLEFISNPSKLRRVGRMIARKAGTLHIVQLNRPPSGMYGIYISQTEARSGIFISRFADANAAKFYSGLLSPGDEIIRVNKEKVKNKSVDDVYDMLETLDTVIFTVVPVCSRPDW